MAFPEGLSPAQVLYPDLDSELASTRKILALIPDGREDYAPHTKSMKLGPLATHLVDLVGFGKVMLTSEMMDFAVTPWTSSTHANTAARLAAFDKSAADLKSALAGASWADFEKNWQLRMGDVVYINDRKSTLIRTSSISHITHHRAQLVVYLRLLDIPIPGLYGPSADEM